MLYCPFNTVVSLFIEKFQIWSVFFEFYLPIKNPLIIIMIINEFTIVLSGRYPHLGGGGPLLPHQRGLHLLHPHLPAQLLAQGKSLVYKNNSFFNLTPFYCIQYILYFPALITWQSGSLGGTIHEKKSRLKNLTRSL